MAACGPTTAFQSMKDYVQRDASLQRETVTSAGPRQAGFRTTSRDTSASQFEAFNTARSRLDFHNELMPDVSTPQAFPRVPPPADVGYMAYASKPALTHSVHRPAPAAAADWTAEFQNLSLREKASVEQQHYQGLQFGQHDQFTQQSQLNPLGQFGQLGSVGRLGQFGNFGPQFISTQGVFPLEGASQGSAVDSALDAAFKEAEQNLQKLQQRDELEKEQLNPPAQNRGEDASAIASNIIKKVNERADPELANKVKGSKFMTLMGKLQSNEIKIDAQEFVDTTTNAAMDPDTLNQPYQFEDLSSTQDWPPQRHASTTGEREQPPEVAEEPKRRYRFSKDLDDPDTYLRKLRKNLDPRLFAKSPYMSPLFHAQDVSPPQAVNASAWEERYEEW